MAEALDTLEQDQLIFIYTLVKLHNKFTIDAFSYMFDLSDNLKLPFSSGMEVSMHFIF